MEFMTCETHWLLLTELFNLEGCKRVSGVVIYACEGGKKRPVMVVDLSKEAPPPTRCCRTMVSRQ